MSNIRAIRSHPPQFSRGLPVYKQPPLPGPFVHALVKPFFVIGTEKSIRVWVCNLVGSLRFSGALFWVLIFPVRWIRADIHSSAFSASLLIASEPWRVPRLAQFAIWTIYGPRTCEFSARISKSLIPSVSRELSGILHRGWWAWRVYWGLRWIWGTSRSPVAYGPTSSARLTGYTGVGWTVD